jgi:hypothetical protein
MAQPIYLSRPIKPTGILVVTTVDAACEYTLGCTKRWRCEALGSMPPRWACSHASARQPAQLRTLPIS